MAEGPRYSFHPLERRGVLLGLDASQLMIVGVAALLALLTHTAVGGRIGFGAAVIVLAGGVVAGIWRRDGAPLALRTFTGMAWLGRRSAGPRLDDLPLRGRPLDPRAKARSNRPKGIELVVDPGAPGDRGLAVIRDRRAGTWSAVVPVRGCSFSLLDPDEQARKLEGWRRVLGATARPDTPVVRLQWLQRSGWSDRRTTEADDPAGVEPSSDARASYRQLLESAYAGLVCHDAWLVVVVTAGRRQLGSQNSAPPALRRELRFLEGQLRSADLDPGRPLDSNELRGLISSSTRRSAPWALASEETWDAYRADGDWHVTYWIAEWPRVDVAPDFLGPLLLTQARTAVSVLMSPVPADRAMRSVRSARTADLADAQLRAKAGFLPSARRERESEGATQREEELADGHQDFRFSGYVTVTASSREELGTACAEVEHAAQAARLELRRLFGRQAEAYTWTQPLGRGLR